MKKIKIKVVVSNNHDGTVIPKTVIWNDGRKFDINRVLYRTTSSINEYDGIGYTVLIGNMEKFIYQYGREWYVMA